MRVQDEHTWGNESDAYIVVGTSHNHDGSVYSTASAVLYAKNTAEAEGQVLAALRKAAPGKTYVANANLLREPIDWNSYRRVSRNQTCVGWAPSYIIDMYNRGAISTDALYEIAARQPDMPVGMSEKGAN